MNIIIIGSGGHAGVVIDAVQKLGEFKIVRLLDVKPYCGSMKHGYQVDEYEEKWSHFFAFIAIGDNKVREELSKRELNYISVIHPTAEASKQNCHGSYFGANSIVGPNSKVGNFSIINTGVILEHDSVVGDYSHLAPGVVTGGRVKIGSRTFIGLNSTVKDGVTIGSNCIIGQGSNVICDVPDNTVWFGNPAKLQKEIK